MSSWLNLSGNLSSNISSNLSSITGHITSFTREVLTEGTEELYDQDAELSIAKSKIRELEARLQNQKNEWDRINKLNEDLRDRAESVELQMRAVSGQYRVKLEEKDNEIKQLKQSQTDFVVDFHDNKAINDSWLETDDTEHQSVVVDRLQREIADLHADCQYWKDVANSKQNADADINALKEEHQQHLNTLQATYSQKVSKLKKKYKVDQEAWGKEKEELQLQMIKLKDSTDTDGGNKKSDEDLVTLQTALKNAEDRLTHYDELLKEKEKIESRLEKERSEFDATLADKDEIIMSLDDEIRRMTENISEKDKFIAYLEEEKVNLTKCLYNQEIGLEEKNDIGQSDKANLVEKGTQADLLDELIGTKLKHFKEVEDKLSHANDENVSLALENNKLAEELDLVRGERDEWRLRADAYSENNIELAKAVQTVELERDAAVTEHDRIEDSVKELEELRYDVTKLQSWTEELVEELGQSKEIQDEQTFELESLRHICQLKEEPLEEIKSLRHNIKRVAEQHVDLFHQYKTVSDLLKDANQRLVNECSLRYEAAAMVADFGCQVNVNMDNNIDTVESLRAEKAILERTIEGLERRAGTLEDMFEDMHDRKKQSVSRTLSQDSKKRLTGQPSNEHMSHMFQASGSSDDPDKPSLPDKEQISTPGKDRAFSPCSVLSQDGSYFDDEQPRKIWGESDLKIAELEGHVVELVNKIQGYERFVVEMESKEREWVLEKSALENVIIDLQKKLKNQESAYKMEEGSFTTLNGTGASEPAGVKVQNRCLETDLSLLDIDELFQLTTINKELTFEIEMQRKLIISAENCFIDVIDKLRKLVTYDALKNPEFLSRLKLLPNDNHSNTLKRIEKLKYLVELLTEEHVKQEVLHEKEKELTAAMQENTRIKGECDMLQKEAKKNAEDLLSLSQEKEALLVSVEALKTDHNLLKDDFSNRLSERDEMQLKLEELKSQIDNKESENNHEIFNLSQKVEELELEKEKLLSGINERNMSIHEQHENFETLIGQVTEEKDKDLLELQEQQEQIMDMYKKKQKEMELLMSEKHHVVNKVAYLEDEVNSLNAKLEQSMTELQERPSCQQILENEILIKQLNDELRQLEQEKLQYLENASQQIESLEDELAEHVEHANELEIKLLNAETDLSKRDDEVMRLGEKLKNQELQHTEYEIGSKQLGKNDVREVPGSVPSNTNETNRKMSAEEGPSSSGDSAETSLRKSSKQAVTGNVVDTVDISVEKDVAKEKRDEESLVILLEKLDNKGKEIAELLATLQERDKTVKKLSEETERFMKVIKTKDELLLDLQSADLEDANSESRQKIIAYIREIEISSQTLEDKLSSAEEMISHFESQLDLMKKDRQDLLEVVSEQEQELNDVNERLENVEARSKAKEHASSVLHHEHQKLLELNHSQGEEIAKLREKIHALQGALESKHEQIHQMSGLQNKCVELEKEIAAFQEEEERLLTLLHEKESKLRLTEEAMKHMVAPRSSPELDEMRTKSQALENQVMHLRQKLAMFSGSESVMEQAEPPSTFGAVGVMDRNSPVEEHILSPIAERAVGSSNCDGLDQPFRGKEAINRIDESRVSDIMSKLERVTEEKMDLLSQLTEIKQLLDSSEVEKMQLLGRYQAQIKEKDESISNLQGTHDEITEQYKRELHDLTKKLELMTAEKRQLVSDLTEQKHRCECIKSEQNHLLALQEELMQDRNNQIVELQRLQTELMENNKSEELGDLRNKVDKVVAENIELYSQLTALKQHIETLETERNQLLALQEEIAGARNAQKKEVQGDSEWMDTYQLSDAEKKLNEVAAENTKLVSQLTELKQRFDSLETEKNKVCTPLKEAVNENNITKPGLQALNSELTQEGVSKSSDNLEKINKLTAENLQLTSLLAEVKQSLSSVENEKNQLLTFQQRLVHERNEQVSDLQRALHNAKATEVELQKREEAAKKQILSDCEQRTKLLVRDMEAKVKTKEEELKGALEKVEILRATNEKLKAAGSSNDAERVKLEAMQIELEKMNALYEKNQHELKAQMEELNRYQNIVSASEAALEKSQEDNRQWKLVFEKKAIEHKELEKENGALHRRTKELETEIRRLTISYREVEAKAAKDIERLKNHLLEVEESYTNEALVAQEREDTLVRTVNNLQKEVETLRNEYQEASVSAKRQRTELQEQLFSLATHRDSLVMQVSSAKEEAQQHANAMNNLQRALEQFQKDKNTQHDMLAEQSRKDITKAKQEIAELKEKEKDYENRMNEAKLAVQGVSNLSRQLELKDSENDYLKEQISGFTGQIHLLEEEIQASRVASENKLDKAIVKNVMLGYFHTPENKRAEVVYVIGNLLGFSKGEIEQIGTGSPPTQRGWVSSMLPFGGGKTSTALAHPGNPGSLNKSFTEAFVSFLEQESTSAMKTQGAVSNRLTSLMIGSPTGSSTPFRSGQVWPQPQPQPQHIMKETQVSSANLPVSSTTSSQSSTNSLPMNPLLYNPRPVLFPAPGQEIPKVHTHTANSALKSMLSA